MSFLQVENTIKLDATKLVQILKGISFELQQFKKLAIAGETGSGKSTLLKIIAGTLQADGGNIFFENKEVFGPDDKLLPWHPAIGYLSQHFELRNNYRVEEVLAIANKMSEKEANEIFSICRIDHLLKQRTNQLSGGEKQRIATAQALIKKPRLLLLDEPYSNLDVTHKNILKTVLNDITNELQITCILTSHDPLDTLSWADEIMVLNNGSVVQTDIPVNIYNSPVDLTTAGLFGRYSLLPQSTLLSKLYDGPIDQIQKKLVYRPSDFVLVSANSGAKGIISKKYFHGSFLEIEVQLEDVYVTVLTDNLQLKIDDEVNVALKPLMQQLT